MGPDQMALGELGYLSVGQCLAFERTQHEEAVREAFAMQHADLLGRSDSRKKRSHEEQRQYR